MVVADASAIIDLLLARPAAAPIAGVMAEHDHDVHVPHLLDVEVAAALRRLVASGEADDARAREALLDLVELGMTRHPHDSLLARVWSLRANVSAHDATYVSLAEVVAEGGVPLMTTDRRLARAATDHTELDVLVP